MKEQQKAFELLKTKFPEGAFQKLSMLQSMNYILIVVGLVCQTRARLQWP